ncbi:hypothetical protein EV188_103224 [Actinomycetospora succinea]|uniref:Small secreted domain DUF320 n=1 Tax=Actinomycetospora succinea TaxID=663603 RepID=A0A4R6VD97_9PSEU|nr:hypothetical protein [Actinomycetospora succinea]TDQ60722.1 hypothetical protein EV188_103224 [Actinomycetospora succinea]
MSFLRRAALAGALAGTALASTSGSAFAAEAGSDGDQHGLVNVGDVQTITPVNACNNDVPVNAAGVQVPVEDVSGVLDLGLLGGGDNDGPAAQPESLSCDSGTDAAA